MNWRILKNNLEERKYDQCFLDLYEESSLLDYQYKRYIEAIDIFHELYNDEDIEVYSAAGRSEVGGNHTDHQHGRVLAAAINLDAIAVVSKREDVIKIKSDDMDISSISLSDLDKKDEEEGTSESLVRGILSKMKELGYQIGGFNAYITSDVLIGAGLSSSASFEILIGTIINGLYNNMSIDNVTIAKIGQYSENIYFNKPCGLMDQCACGVGGLISIDFKDPSKPIVNKVNADFGDFHHSLCIVDAKGSHASLTHEYASIPDDMKKVAKFFHQEYLRDVNEEDFLARLPILRKKTHDRAVLRAYHFFKENNRVKQLVEALEALDFNTFKALIKESGDSSYKVLQNVYASSDPHHQSLSIALTISQDLLGNHGVCRVHGGGFAGTIQAFVEDDYVSTYKEGIEKIFGKGTCHILKVRKYGGKKVFD